jgi:hypothetical protein
MPRVIDATKMRDDLGLLRTQLMERAAPDLIANPALADALTNWLDDQIRKLDDADKAAPGPPDGGVAELAGIGPTAASNLGVASLPVGVANYDDSVASERIQAMADLYYIYQHERVGVFRAVRQLQALFKAGTVRLGSGEGAFGLYQFDRREVLRHTRLDRAAAYRRTFGYGTRSVARGAQPNPEFHPLFVHFMNQVALYWRDKRVSDVIRERAYDPSFGSIAIVRRAGLDLRNNLKFASFGHVNVLRVEVMQVLEEAFRILESDDIKRLFGADNAWDVVEEVLLRYFNQRIPTSARQRMAVAGREVLRWLSQAFVLQNQRAEFEGLLLEIAEYAEEWITSAQSVGAARRLPTGAERTLRASTTRGNLSPPPAATVPLERGGVG